MLNNRRIYQDIADGIKNMLACANTASRHNVMFGTDDLNHGMLKGAHHEFICGQMRTHDKTHTR